MNNKKQLVDLAEEFFDKNKDIKDGSLLIIATNGSKSKGNSVFGAGSGQVSWSVNAFIEYLKQDSDFCRLLFEALVLGFNVHTCNENMASKIKEKNEKGD